VPSFMVSSMGALQRLGRSIARQVCAMAPSCEQLNCWPNGDPTTDQTSELNPPNLGIAGRARRSRLCN